MVNRIKKENDDVECDEHKAAPDDIRRNIIKV